jgi:hypothetical protein
MVNLSTRLGNNEEELVVVGRILDQGSRVSRMDRTSQGFPVYFGRLAIFRTGKVLVFAYAIAAQRHIEITDHHIIYENSAAK